MTVAIFLAFASVAEIQVQVVRTARYKDGTTDLLKEMPPLKMEKMDKPCDEHKCPSLQIDHSKTYQTVVGFGGAFTEAAAINWRLLSQHDQEEVIRRYFASPEEGGLGYTLGRVPINSCDFSPASYNFDNVTGDMDLKNFDMSVKHDVDVGMVPMIKAAQDMISKRGAKLMLYASPWSPPAWMKLPVDGKKGMTISASPNGLDPAMQRPWAKYYSKFISAYKAQGIDMWGVTVQNEPEAAVGWEACLWTPQYTAEFVKNHLGPVLHEEQPGVKIIGFDHNKDHVLQWAKVLYADANAKKYFDGIGVHWYGGLNTHNLNQTHEIAPDKFILATEACNCGGVVFKTPKVDRWWSRAESLALDILEDLKFWAVGWTDWNLILSPSGGPNHLKNMCDANIIADPSQTMKLGTLIMQASYYFMGHFSRYILPGSVQISVKNMVETHIPPLTADDVKNGQALVFESCAGSAVQAWTISEGGDLSVVGTDTARESDGYHHGGMCADQALDSAIPKVQVWACFHSGQQIWKVKSVDGGKQLVNDWTGQCLTAVETSGTAVGLDPGVTVVAGQYKDCIDGGDPSQTFVLANYDGGGYPDNFPVRTSSGLCLQPQITRVPHFDSVGFKAPDGSTRLVTMNTGDGDLKFDIYDASLGAGIKDVTLPAHSIQTYVWSGTADEAAAAVPAHAPDTSATNAAAAAAPTLMRGGQSASTLLARQFAEPGAAAGLDATSNSDSLVKLALAVLTLAVPAAMLVGKYVLSRGCSPHSLYEAPANGAPHSCAEADYTELGDAVYELRKAVQEVEKVHGRE